MSLAQDTLRGLRMVLAHGAQAVRSSRTRGIFIPLVLVFGAFALIALVAGKMELATVIGAILGGILVALAWSAIVSGTRAHLTAATVRLVPGHFVRCRRAIHILAFLTCTIAAVLGHAATGMFAVWWAGALLFLAIIAIGAARIGTLVINLTFWGGWALSRMDLSGFQALWLSIAGQVFLCVASLSVWVLASSRCFPAAGDPYLDRDFPLVPQMLNQGSQQPLGSNGLFSRVYGMVLRADCNSRRPERLLLHVLGPQVHWCNLVVSLGVTIAIVFLFGDLIGAKLDEVVPIESASIGIMAALAISIPVLVYQFNARAEATTVEQSLVCLTPSIPLRSSLNRFVARAMVLRFLAHWSSFMAAIGAAMLLLPDLRSWLLVFAACMACTLMFMGAMLHNYARSDAPHLPLAGALILIAVWLVLFWIARTATGLPWLWFAAGAVILSIGWLASRWRAMLAMPPAFPAARIG